jgi:hypothetical protein
MPLSNNNSGKLGHYRKVGAVIPNLGVGALPLPFLLDP